MVHLSVFPTTDTAVSLIILKEGLWYCFSLFSLSYIHFCFVVVGVYIWFIWVTGCTYNIQYARVYETHLFAVHICVHVFLIVDFVMFHSLYTYFVDSCVCVCMPATGGSRQREDGKWNKVKRKKHTADTGSIHKICIANINVYMKSFPRTERNGYNSNLINKHKKRWNVKHTQQTQKSALWE